MLKNNIFLSVIIPTINEAKRITPTLQSVREYLQSKNYHSEVIIVDDGSQDETIQIARNFIWPKKIHCQLLLFRRNRGKGWAVKQGVLQAKGKYTIFMDADNSTPLDQLEKMLVYQDQFPILIGSRYLKSNSLKIKQNLFRKITSRMGNFLIKLISGLNFTDTQCGFKFFPSYAAKRIFSQATIDRWGFDIEILVIAQKLGYQVKEVAIDWSDSPQSKLRAGRDALKTLKELWQIRKNLIQGKYQ